MYLHDARRPQVRRGGSSCCYRYTNTRRQHGDGRSRRQRCGKLSVYVMYETAGGGDTRLDILPSRLLLSRLTILFSLSYTNHEVFSYLTSVFFVFWLHWEPYVLLSIANYVICYFYFFKRSDCIYYVDSCVSLNRLAQYVCVCMRMCVCVCVCVCLSPI